jgi:hypothetical protein
MEDACNQLAKQMAEAIAAAVSGCTEVDDVLERARASGFELRVKLDAVVSFVTPGKKVKDPVGNRALMIVPKTNKEITAHDRRLLRGMRIGCPEEGTESAE